MKYLTDIIPKFLWNIIFQYLNLSSTRKLFRIDDNCRQWFSVRGKTKLDSLDKYVFFIEGESISDYVFALNECNYGWTEFTQPRHVPGIVLIKNTNLTVNNSYPTNLRIIGTGSCTIDPSFNKFVRLEMKGVTLHPITMINVAELILDDCNCCMESMNIANDYQYPMHQWIKSYDHQRHIDSYSSPISVTISNCTFTGRLMINGKLDSFKFVNNQVTPSKVDAQLQLVNRLLISRPKCTISNNRIVNYCPNLSCDFVIETNVPLMITNNYVTGMRYGFRIINLAPSDHILIDNKYEKVALRQWLSGSGTLTITNDGKTIVRYDK